MMTNIDLSGEADRLSLPLVGIYNKDELHEQPVQSGFYIINMSDSVDSKGKQLPGTHWVCFLVENKEACYFDSFGFSPAEEVKIYLEDFIPFPYNDKHIQNIYSGVCGFYVIGFMIFMVENYKKYRSLKDRLGAFVRLFSNDVKKNQTILNKFLKPY